MVQEGAKDRIQALKMWMWRITERTKQVDRVRNEEVLNRVKVLRDHFFNSC